MLSLLVFPKHSIASASTRGRACTPDGTLNHYFGRRLLGHVADDRSYQQGERNRPYSVRERTEQC